MRSVLRSTYRSAFRVFSGMGLTNIRVLHVLNDFIISHLKSNSAYVHGHKMFLDPEDSLHLSLMGVYEPTETDLVKRTIQAGDVALDIGAHIGYYTLMLARLVGPNGRVFAFEVDPDNFALLRKNVEINGYRNVTLVQKAVSDRTGTIRLFLADTNSAQHTICSAGRSEGSASVEVEAIRLDDYFEGYTGRIDFVKMDIEGSEPAVFRGMPLLLGKNQNLKLITEVCPPLLKQFGVDPHAFLSQLAEHGFTLYDIRESTGKVQRTDIASVLRNYQHGYTNLFCVKGD